MHSNPHKENDILSACMHTYSHALSVQCNDNMCYIHTCSVHVACACSRHLAHALTSQNSTAWESITTTHCFEMSPQYHGYCTETLDVETLDVHTHNSPTHMRAENVCSTLAPDDPEER